MAVPSVSDVYENAARRFLHSAVVVDDLARLAEADDPVDLPEEILDPRVVPLPAPTQAETPPETEPSSDDEDAAREDAGIGHGDENRLDARALIEGFAALGMVCSTFRPEGYAEGVEELVVRAASRSDIVTIDWHLTTPDDGGKKALEILEQLSQNRGARLRLIAVYTGDPDEYSIAAAIRELPGTQQIEPLVFHRHSSRIVVFFKQGTRLAPGTSGEVVDVAELPDRLVRVFARLCAGLVPSAAMSALGAVREHMHELLAVLNGDHDPAFVGQRLAQSRPDDASDHLVELILGELKTIVDEDDATRQIAGAAAVEAWLEARDPGELAVSIDTLKTLNRLGSNANEDGVLSNADPEYRKLRKRHPTELVVGGNTERADRANALFAERMTVRHGYAGNTPSRLELGVVVCDQERAFWLCMQPLCDSVRISGDSCRMLFLPYKPVDLASRQFDLVISTADSILCLRLGDDPSSLHTIEFPVDPATRTVAARRFAGRWEFVALSEDRYSFVCRLKPDQAQRTAVQLGAVLSRVGLNESEWLRLKSEGKAT